MPHTFTPPSVFSTVAFVGLLVGVQVILVWAAGRAGERVGQRRKWMLRALLFALAVAGGSSALSAFVLRPDFAPPTMAFFVLTNLGAVALAFGPPGRALGPALGTGGWVLLQSFRLPLELIMHGWVSAGALPPQMTWTGQNVDILAGALSLVIGLTLLKWPSRKLAYAAHGVGLLLLLNVIRVAATSTPGPLQQFEEPVLLAFHFPFVWIVPFAVGVALFSHLTALRALWGRGAELGA